MTGYPSTARPGCALVSNADFITAKAELNLQQVALDAELELALRQMQQAASLNLRTLLEHLDIDVARASYRDLAFNLEQAGETQTPVLSITGRFQGKPMEMTIETEFKGSILRPLALKGLDLELGLKGPNAGRLLGIPLPDLGHGERACVLRRTGKPVVGGHRRQPGRQR